MAPRSELCDRADREAFIATRESCVINSGPGCGKTRIVGFTIRQKKRL